MMRQRKFYLVFLVAFVLVCGSLVFIHNFSASGEVLRKNPPVLAIVIDDFGGADKHGVAEFMSMNIPITMAVMPNLIHSVEQSEEAHQKGHEVILHQPMEPVKGKKSWLGPGAITYTMNTEEIKTTFAKNLESVPHASGFNNHTGSKLTSNREKVTPMLEVAKKKGLYVLDSRTSQDSQVIPAAKAMQLPWVKRDIFLDDVKSVVHIKKQMKKACRIAKKQGYVVVIGHVGQGGKITAQAVKDALPLIEQEGIKIVPLSEIVRLNNEKGKV